MLNFFRLSGGEISSVVFGTVVLRNDRSWGGATVYHCSTHDIDHASYDCPRCEAERRHEELLEQARESHEEELQFARESHEAELRSAQERHEEAIAAAEASDYRRANPGDYECPHCKYISLKRGGRRAVHYATGGPTPNTGAKSSREKLSHTSMQG